MSATKTIQIEVLRYRPEQDSEPVWQSYTVPYTDDMSVLQGLQHIKDELDGTLSFRWSCRMAICGSCGMMINGKPHLSCQTFLREFLPGETAQQEAFDHAADHGLQAVHGTVAAVDPGSEGAFAGGQAWARTLQG